MAVIVKAVTSEHLELSQVTSVRLDAARLQEGVNSMDNQFITCLSPLLQRQKCPALADEYVLGDISVVNSYCKLLSCIYNPLIITI